MTIKGRWVAALGLAVFMVAGMSAAEAENGPVAREAEIHPSSIRWKEHVQPIANALTKTLGLRGVFYDWKPEYGGQHDIGFIAEEVGRVVPELVEWEVDGEWAVGVKYERVTALVVEAVRELNDCVERLQEYLLKLQSQVESQANLISEHETAISEQQADICALQTQVVALQTSTALLQAENVQMKNEIAELRAMIAELSAQVSGQGGVPAAQ